MKTTRGPKLNFKSSRNFSFEFAAEILSSVFWDIEHFFCNISNKKCIVAKIVVSTHPESSSERGPKIKKITHPPQKSQKAKKQKMLKYATFNGKKFPSPSV